MSNAVENQPRNEYSAAFTLIGDFDPDEIAAKLGFDPDQLSSMHDTDLETMLPRRRVFWSRGSRLDKHTDVEQHVIDVLDQIAFASQAISELCKEYEGWMQIIATYLYSPDRCCLRSTTAGRVAALGLDVVFETYNLLPSKDS